MAKTEVIEEKFIFHQPRYSSKSSFLVSCVIILRHEDKDKITYELRYYAYKPYTHLIKRLSEERLFPWDGRIKLLTNTITRSYSETIVSKLQCNNTEVMHKKFKHGQCNKNVLQEDFSTGLTNVENYAMEELIKLHHECYRQAKYSRNIKTTKQDMKRAIMLI